MTFISQKESKPRLWCLGAPNMFCNSWKFEKSSTVEKFQFYKNLFDNYNSFALLQKMLEFFYNVLTVIFPYSFAVSLFSGQKLCVFVSVVPFQVVKFLIGFV